MKRTHAAKSAVFSGASDGERSFWPSYADMMSAVALILFFLMLLSYIQNLITGNDLQNTQELLSSTRTELSDTQTLLSTTLQQVDDAETELAKITVDLEDARYTLALQQEQINAQQASITAQDAALLEQEALIASQKDYIRDANEELVAMRSQMQSIAVLRLSILEQIKDSLTKVMGSSAKVSIGDNGNIILSESILFDVGSSEIKPNAEPALNQLAKVFASFLADSENARYVDSIVISGHTDSKGDAEFNRVLSTERANAVLNYIMAANNATLEQYASYFCAAGYGESRPVETNDTDEGKAANRRIEISITLKDDSILEIVENYLDLDIPSVDSGT